MKMSVPFSPVELYFSCMQKPFELYFASSNTHKKTEMQRLVLPGVRIILPSEAGITSFDPVEDGDSFIQNALIKARCLYSIVRAPVLADDSGLAVDALGGRPGIHTSRYGCEDGRRLTSRQQYMMLLDEMKDRSSRSARFVCAAVLMLSPDRIYVVQETVEGEIAKEPLGENGFGYDPVFIVSGTGLSASQLSDEEKDRLCHRGRAMRRINRLIEEVLDEEK